MNKKIFSGVQPTGNLHLGNYLGAIKNFVQLQNDKNECIYCVVDLHSITVKQDSNILKKNIRETTAAFLASGLDPKNKPKISLFDNKYNYNKMLIEKNINLNSTCEHHFLPITGKAHVSYISSGKVIGLSKLNRIVQYYSHRPQVQERLTTQIYNELK